jgi:outer membrane protein assembly factor BamB
MKQYYDVIAAIGSDGKVKWISELFYYERTWRHIIEGRNAMYLVILNSSNVYLQALGYDGKVRYEFRADDYWNERFYSTFGIGNMEPAIDKDDTIYIAFSNPDFGDLCIIYAINSDGTLKWKCKLPFATWGLEMFFYCDQAGKLFLIHSRIFGYCLYVINSNGELSWRYEYPPEQKSPFIAEDGTIYFFSKNQTYIRRPGEMYLTPIPVVVISNYDDPKAKKEAFELGVKEYLLKTDYTPQQLVEKIKKIPLIFQKNVKKS